MAAYDKLQDARNGTQKEQVEANAAFRAAKTAASQKYLEGVQNAYNVGRDMAAKIVIEQNAQEQQNKRNAATVAGQLQASRESSAASERLEALRQKGQRELKAMELKERLQRDNQRAYATLIEKWQKEGPNIMRQYPNIRSFDDWLLQQNIDQYLSPPLQAGGAAGATGSGITVGGRSANQQPN